jgi:hypothetical protein
MDNPIYLKFTGLDKDGLLKAGCGCCESSKPVNIENLKLAIEQMENFILICKNLMEGLK